jgi:uncharacterized protein YjbI with pentapeptide repeats
LHEIARRLRSIRLDAPDDDASIESMRAFEKRLRPFVERDDRAGLSPPLTEETVSETERELGFRVPKDLRWFLLNVGGGFWTGGKFGLETFLDRSSIEVFETTNAFLEAAFEGGLRDLDTGELYPPEAVDALRELLERLCGDSRAVACVPIDDGEVPLVVLALESGAGYLLRDARAHDSGIRPYLERDASGAERIQTFASLLATLPVAPEEAEETLKLRDGTDTQRTLGAHMRDARNAHSRIVLDHTVLSGRKLPDMKGVSLRGADLRGTWIPGSLRDADLQGADLRDATLSRADLTGSDLRDARLGGANLAEAILRSARLDGADLSGVDLRESTLSSASLRGTNLAGATLARISARDAVFAGANLRGADMEEAVLERADLSLADLREARLRGANLRSANLVGARLESADLGGASLEGVRK